MFDTNRYRGLPDRIRNAPARGKRVPVVKAGVDAIFHQIYGCPPPPSMETLVDALECAAPDAEHERLRLAGKLKRQNSHNARGRQWWVR